MIFKTRTMYAINFMRLVAMEKDGLPVPTIALERNGVPRAYCASIATDLIRAGIIKAKVGRSGGYTLAKAAKVITVYDVVSAVESPYEGLTIGGLGSLIGDVTLVLSQHTLADLAK